MLDSIYSAYTGLLSFNKALSVVSNNVSNMNTPGFKSSDLTFRDLFYQFSSSGGQATAQESQIGEGTNTSGTRINFAQGTPTTTGNPLDVAITGNGFFVVKDANDNTYYTRAGQFDVNASGYLVDKTTAARVQAVSGKSDLNDINLSHLQTSAAKATTDVSFVGNLSRGATTDQIASITVYDSVGGSHTLSMTLNNNNTATTGSWTVQVQDENSKTIGNGEIRFNADGSPATGYNTVTLSLAPDGVTASNITLDFGTAGGFSGATNFSGGTTSDLKMNTQDGHAAGSLVSTSFDTQGFITLSYSNGQTAKGPQLALAWFNNLQGLHQVGNEMFTNPTNMMPLLSSGNGQVTGTLTSNELELSNVDLTQQFTDLVIIQRGYQSSSQVISVANQMIQQLTDMRTGGSSSGG
jgi:flagellar hook protein FlgE